MAFLNVLIDVEFMMLSLSWFHPMIVGEKFVSFCIVQFVLCLCSDGVVALAVHK